MGAVIDARRARTKERFDALLTGLQHAEGLLADKACVYATGSVARGEVGDHSDLDLFIVGYSDEKGGSYQGSTKSSSRPISSRRLRTTSFLRSVAMGSIWRAIPSQISARS